jgi:aspartate-semialdehyde dehydrogenase
MALAPLRVFGIERVSIVSMQAVSGAGYPGVASLDILDNVVPYIGGEEDKVETETRRMLGALVSDRVEWLDAAVGASCNRVAVVDGHMVNISFSLRAQPALDEILAAWAEFRGPAPIPSLPSAPELPVVYLTQPDRPQVRRDRAAGRGMTTSVGRLREDPVLGYKFAALSHNTVRGAAGCSILNAELRAVKGYINGFEPEVAGQLAEAF